MLLDRISEMKVDPVSVEVKASLPKIDLVATEIGPIAAGSTVEMERWQAEVLAEWGIVVFPEDSASLLLRIYASRDKEQGGRSLEQIEDIFHSFPRLMEALEREGLRTQKMGAVRGLFEDLVSSRTNKITKISRLAQNPNMDSLTPEERWLYVSLRRIFDTWRRGTRSLIEDSGGERT